TDTWTVTATMNAPLGRAFHSAVWTGSKMIVWGGIDDFGNGLNTGGMYDPTTDTWTATSINHAPSARGGQATVWTGSEMIVWGGADRADSSATLLTTGGRYNPGTDSWTAISITNAPSGRVD